MTTIIDPGYLSIVGRTTTGVLATPAVFLKQAWRLRGTGATRGGDRLIPGGSGVRPYPRRSTITSLTLPLDINGMYDDDGNPTSNPCGAVVDKLEVLKSELFVGAVSGTVANVLAATLHHPAGGANLTGSIRVSEIAPRDVTLGGPVWTCDITFELPFGRLA